MQVIVLKMRYQENLDDLAQTIQRGRTRSTSLIDGPRVFRPSASRPVSLTAQWLACDRCQVAPCPGPKSQQRRTVSRR